jgi:hypothetical protein
MSPEQKQAAMQKLVDEAQQLKKRWREIDQHRAGTQISVDKLKAEGDSVLAEIGVIEEMLKILETTEAKDPSPPAEPPADEPGSTPPPAPKKK